DVISRQIICFGDGRIDASDEPAFPLDWQPRRDEEIDDRAKCSAGFSIDAILIGRPLAKKDSCVRDQVGVVDEIGNLLHQLRLSFRSQAGRQVDVGGRHFASPCLDPASLRACAEDDPRWPKDSVEGPMPEGWLALPCEVTGPADGKTMGKSAPPQNCGPAGGLC